MPAFNSLRSLWFLPSLARSQRGLRAASLLGVSLLVACATPNAPVPTPSPVKAPVVVQKSPVRTAADKAAAPAPAPHPVSAASVAAPGLSEPVVLIAPLDGGGPVGSPASDAGASTSPEPAPTGLGKPLAQGLASWYGPGFHGRRTANGERYDMHALTAAHKTLPFGTRVRVRSVHTGKEVVVRINDRGPYKHQRIIDLSLAAITALGARHRGVTEVVLLRE